MTTPGLHINRILPAEHSRRLDQPDLVRLATAFVLSILLMFSGASLCSAQTQTSDVGHVTGVGGIFFKSKNPKALAAWYRDVLGIKVEQWGGAVMHYDAPDHPPVLVLTPFGNSTDYMEPSQREFMLDLAVDDLDTLVRKLEGKGVTILKRDNTDTNGKFAWILDPDGTKIELWEPKKP